MKKLSVSGLVLAAFLVGCAAAMVAAPIVVPPVRAGTSPTKWEYNCMNNNSGDIRKDQFEADSTKMGEQGWEMATSYSDDYGHVTCFKRPL